MVHPISPRTTIDVTMDQQNSLLLTYPYVEPYTSEYYEYIRKGALSSARVVSSLVVQLYYPRTIVDLGCGTGEWLRAFSELGVTDVLGVDAEHLSAERLSIPSERFQVADLSKPFRLANTFDLAISLEVAEHLPPERSHTFVEDLCALSNVVLFSAAVPGQGDEKTQGHYSLRWQSWWAAQFSLQNYEAVDCVRPVVWNDERVEPWYAQNAILYIDRATLTQHEPLREAKVRFGSFPLDVVHPRRDLVSLGVLRQRKAEWGKKRARLKNRIKRLQRRLEERGG